MKNYLLFLLMCVVIGCGSDKKNKTISGDEESKIISGDGESKTIKYYEEEILVGNVKEITLSRYVDIFKEDEYFLNTKIINNLNINGNVIETKEFRVNNPYDEKSLYLYSKSIYTYNNEKGLNTKSNFNMDGIIIEKDTITLMNDNTIKILMDIDNGVFESKYDEVFDSKYIISIDSDFRVSSKIRYIKNSVEYQRIKKIWSGKNIKKEIIKRIGDKEYIVDYKYNKFDKIGNWIERDVIFFSGEKLYNGEKIIKEKRNISYYK